jgi:TPP-dependent pyruvate/acetoin dehydrogenase alpha subunit
MKKIFELPSVRQVTHTKLTLQTFEARVAELYELGEIKAPIHLSDGNEEELLWIFEKVSPHDYVFTTWRSHYHALLHGVDSDWLLAEIVGGRSMGIINDTPYIYSSSIVGGTVPAALGSAYKFSKDGSGRRAWLFVGDMTARSGLFMEAYTYARNFSLPLQIVVEDNGRSVTTDTSVCWNSELISQDLIYHYKFSSKYPHHGTGKWVNF